MLDAMRRSARSFGMKIVLMIIVLTFVFMGAGSILTRNPDELASVNGEPVTVEEFQRTYANIVENIRHQFGGSIDAEFLKMLNVEQQALDSIIEKKLLLQVAAEKSFQVADEALIDSITRVPAFQTNGRFDRQRYETLLAQNRLTPRQFEEMQRESILIQQLQDYITNTVNVSESEARAWHDWENTEIDVQYVTFSSDDFIDGVDITEEEILAYYKENNDQYRRPAMVNVKYVRFHPEQFVTAADVTDEDVAAHYARNQDEYAMPETATASHILIGVRENATPEEVDEKKAKAVEIYDKAVAGEDFADLARNHSDCPSSTEGGHLGTFTRQDMITPFSDKAFALEPGEIGEPVRTRFGWHVIRLEERQERSVKPLSEVEDEIRNELARQRTGNVAYERAMEMYDISFDADDLVENAERFGYEVKQTGFFSRSQGPDNLRDARAFADAAFELPLNQVSDILEIDGTYYLLLPIERQDPEIPELEAVRADVERNLASEKSRNSARSAAESLLADAMTAGSIDEATENVGRTVVNTGFFTRTHSSVPGIGRAPEFGQAAFNIGKAGEIHDSVINASGKYVVLGLAEKRVPDESVFKENKENTMVRLEAKRKEEVFLNWMANLREQSEIKISTRFTRHLQGS